MEEEEEINQRSSIQECWKELQKMGATENDLTGQLCTST